MTRSGCDRGDPFLRLSGSAVDIGAYEYQDAIFRGRFEGAEPAFAR